MGELALIGLPAQDEEEEEGEEGDGGLEVLPGGQLGEFALDFKEEVILVPHTSIDVIIN